MDKEKKAKIVSRLEQVLQAPPGSLNGSMKMNHYPGWDSMVQLEILLVLEEELSVEMNEENIRKYSSMDNILALIESGE